MKNYRALGVILTLVAALGCATTTTEELSANSPYRTDYRAGDIYQTQTTVFLEPVGKSTYLYPLGGHSMPKTMADYRREPDAWQVTGFMEAPIRLQIRRVIRHHSSQMGNYFEVQAEVLDGAYRGRVMNIVGLSMENRQTDPFAFVPQSDPRFLRKISQ